MLVVVFISAASPLQQWGIIAGLLFAIIFSFLAFIFRRLTLDGMFAAIVVGTFIFGLGGWAAASVVILFFISSAIISQKRKSESVDKQSDVRRNGLQVWANGFWFVIFLVGFVTFNHDIYLIASLAAIATATADTWGTELRSEYYSSTYLVTNFQHVEPGTDGGISLKGTTASIFGSLIIAAVSIYVFSLQFSVFLCIFIAGFLGSLVDSYFGATFQRNNASVTLPVLQKAISVDNNFVNGISTGAGAVLAIIIKLVIT